jgi:hypothetical protein
MLKEKNFSKLFSGRNGIFPFLPSIYVALGVQTLNEQSNNGVAGFPQNHNGGIHNGKRK